MRTKTTLFILLFTSIIFAQNNFQTNLTNWVNPAKDSIKALKLKDIVTYKITRFHKKIESKTSYNQEGYILSNDDYFFKYDTENKLNYIVFKRTLDPHYRNNAYVYDTIAIDGNVDTNRVFSILINFNSFFRHKITDKMIKNTMESNHYTDTLKSCNGYIVRNNSKDKKEFGCTIEKLIFQNRSIYKNEYIETITYDFSNGYSRIEVNQKDSLETFEKKFVYYPAYSIEDFQIFIGYVLHYAHIQKKGKDFYEDIYEYYTDEDDNNFRYPVFIEHKIFYKTYKEYKEFRCSSAKSKKLVTSYIIKVEYSYFK